jgi:4-hydroxy-4-methyl-2-oxoglutarate aldolase
MTVMNDGSSVPKEVMDLLKEASTGVVSDALALLGFQGGVDGVHPARGFEEVKILGPACTIQFGPRRPDTPKLTNYDIIENLPPGSILVIDAQGVLSHFAGDNVASYCKWRGLAAVVVFGGGRDVAGWRRIGMPLYCTGLATKDKPANMKITGCQIPVEIGGVPVRPGDIIVGDEDGVVVVPQESLGALGEKIRLLFEVEAAMQQAIQRGARGSELSGIIGRKNPK